MKKKLLYGILVFVVGVAMVACGDKNSGSSASPASLPNAIPITNGGILNPTNTGCRGTTCVYAGKYRVVNGDAFASIGATPRFVTPNLNNSNGGLNINGQQISSFDDFLDTFIGSLQFGVQINTDGDVQTGWGIGGGTLNGTNGGLNPIPQSGKTFNGYIRLRTGKLVGSFTLDNGANQGFSAVPEQRPDGSGIYYVDQRNHIALVALEIGGSQASNFGVFYVSPDRLIQAATFSIDRVY